MPYYAVAVGRTPGIFTTWDECKQSVIGYAGAKYKKFDNIGLAEKFVESNSINSNVNAAISDSTNYPLNNIEEFIPDYYVYTDGACSNNGRNGAQCGIGVYFGEVDPRNASEPIVGPDGKRTNNIAELSAIIRAYSIIEKDIVSGRNIMIVSDSEYAIKCVSSYGDKLAANGWKGDIPNKELVQTVHTLYANRPNVRFMYIRAHTDKTDIHSIGNAGADRLATAGAGHAGSSCYAKTAEAKIISRL